MGFLENRVVIITYLDRYDWLFTGCATTDFRFTGIQLYPRPGQSRGQSAEAWKGANRHRR